MPRPLALTASPLDQPACNLVSLSMSVPPRQPTPLSIMQTVPELSVSRPSTTHKNNSGDSSSDQVLTYSEDNTEVPSDCPTYSTSHVTFIPPATVEPASRMVRRCAFKRLSLASRAKDTCTAPLSYHAPVVARERCWVAQLLILSPDKDGWRAYAISADPTLGSIGVVGMESPDEASLATTAKRIGLELFAPHKQLQRRIASSLSTQPSRTVSVNKDGVEVHAATWAVELSSRAASTLRAERGSLSHMVLGDAPHACLSAAWVPLPALVSAVKQRPFDSAHAVPLSLVAEQPSTMMSGDAPLISRSRKRQAAHARLVARAAMPVVSVLPPSSHASTTLSAPRPDLLFPVPQPKWADPSSPVPVVGDLFADRHVARDLVSAARVNSSRSGAPKYDSHFIRDLAQRAQERALQHGSPHITRRDVCEAAAELNRSCSGKKDRAPVDPAPLHESRLMHQLSQLRVNAETLVALGYPRPRVLVAMEKSAIVARAFKEAGCDVATCDLQDSEDCDIPHFKGDARLAVNLGFHLVIAHPPCTYLSNAGSCWLREPGRMDNMLSAARLFTDMINADAPFVAVENPVMHRHARAAINGLRPTQFIHPWQHGHGDTKPTGWYLRGGLPHVRATCEVPGRARHHASMSPSPRRGELRSRTYRGMASAMALSWVPSLIDHVGLGLPRDEPTALDLILQARGAMAAGASSSPMEDGAAHVVAAAPSAGLSSPDQTRATPAWQMVGLALARCSVWAGVRLGATASRS